jgi:sugar-specific transcriptional regulator TrmB
MSIENINLFRERLGAFGLSLSEATVYLYLLQLGKEAGGSSIATATKLHRQYVYNSLPHLIEFGLVAEVPKGKQSKYKAQTPSAIEKFGRKQAVAATDLARDLNTISNIGNEQEFEVIQGEKAMVEFEMDYVLSTKEYSEELIIGGASGGFVKVMGASLEEYLSLKEERGIIVKYIGSQSEIEEFAKKTGKYQNQLHRFLPKMPDGTANMVIRPSEVCFYSFVHPPHVYVVKSKEVADHYKKFFEMLWEMGSELY